MSIIHHDPLKKEVSEALFRIIEQNDVEILSFDAIYSMLSMPPDFNFGQVAFPCFVLAKVLKKSPAIIAKDFANSINNESIELISKAEANGPYVNFYCNFNKLLKYNQTRVFSRNTLTPTQCEHIIVEYSQPNTHKTMHVGHLRCLVLGDAVCNILEYVGHKVVRATYPGDIGTHVAKVVWYLTHPTAKELPSDNKAKWLGEMYAKADVALKETKNTPVEVQVKKDIAQILKEISEKKGKYFELWRETREWSLDYLKSIYQWLNCQFDTWYFESEFDQTSIEYVLQKYKEGFFVKDNGAIGIDLSEFNLGFVMYLKSDGNGLYITKDLLLLMQKLSDPNVTRSLYVVDARQKRHFQQLFKTAELMGHERAARSYHLSYETVNTETGEPFSSRSLTGMEISDLRYTMEQKIRDDYLTRYQDSWAEEEIQQTAEIVCIGALKYGLLSSDNNTQIKFSLSDWLKLDGDTGPYLQYVHARCCSILRKAQIDPTIEYDLKVIDPLEKELLFFIHKFAEVCLQAALHFKPSTIANYLFDLAKLFNRFYEACPILKSESHVQATRLELLKLTQSTIAAGLQLLGIQSPEKM